MRYYIIFGATFILSLIIIIFVPKISYKDSFNDEIILSFDDTDDEYKWSYDIEGDSLINNSNDNPFKFTIVKNGESTISFCYSKNNEKCIHKVSYKFKVRSNIIYWLESEGMGYYVYPDTQ